MDKRSTKAPKKLFDFNLESLLEDDFTQDDEINSQILNKEVCSQPKRIKVKESTVRLRSQSKKQFNNNFELNKNAVDEEFEDVNDISKFFENVSNDFNKSMSVKKARLREFTEAVIKLFQTKITKMINEQEEEIQHFKTETVNKIEIEMKTYEEEIKKLQIQENKLLKILQEQVKLLRKTSDSQKRWIENFTDLHKNFVEQYEKIKIKHKTEALNVKRTINEDALNLQQQFLTETKKGEMETVKKYFNSSFF